MVIKWIPTKTGYRIGAACLATLALIALAEALLRAAGSGYDPRFILPTPDGQQVSANPRFAWRYFPPAMARDPMSFHIPREKAPNTRRILILGDSVAAGFPNVGFGFGRILEHMLRDADPDTTYELINAASVAINSHEARIIGNEARANDVDAIITYLGNTEVVGPYGPGTAFGRHSSSLSAIRFRQWVSGTRLGQWRDRLTLATATPAQAGRDWGGMAMFTETPIAHNDRRLRSVRRHFEKNLVAISNLATADDGPAVLLCTVPTNLREASPFASLFSHAQRGQKHAAWLKVFAEGTNHQAQARFTLAIKSYEDASQIDAEHAELQFRLAQCLEVDGDPERAAALYTSARDRDGLRFRTDSELNATVRRVAQQANAKNVQLADAQAALQSEAMNSTSCPGDDFFHEHVHMNFDGHYIVARCLFDALAKTKGFEALASTTPPRREACAHALALTVWDEYHMALSILDIVRRPPFTQQFDHVDRLQRHVNRVTLLQSRQTEAERVRHVMTYEKRRRAQPDDFQLTTSLARLYTEFGRFDKAAHMWASAAELAPYYASIQHNVGTALARAGRHAKAEPFCRRAVELNPYVGGYYNNLGNIYFVMQRYEDAESAFKHAIKRTPDNSAGYLNLGGVYATVGKNKAALSQFEKTLTRDPGNAKAYNNMGAVFEAMAEHNAASDAYAKAVALDEDYVEARLNLATLLQNQGHRAAALPHYARLVEMHPNDPNMHYTYAVALAAENHIDAAILEVVVALELKPNWKEAEIALKKLARRQVMRKARAQSKGPS
ncbi:MAG: tetratricopeptide repeat protein [Kiritimatiellae bacterium]|nr:tetratricopeptide repeat protein [Kiritimatiellia bacterium]